MNYEISVVMPALNEEANLARAVEQTLQAFKELKINGQIIVVNDGSRDQTATIAQQLSQKNSSVLVIHHERPHGIGASFWEGSERANGDVVTMLPGDGENEPMEILRYLPLMKHVDVVVPFVYNVEVRGQSRRWISRLYKAIINLSFGLLLNYMNGTVMYRRKVLMDLTLNSKGFFYQTELLIKAIRKGYLYAEVPYALGVRPTGRSKALSLPSFFKLSKDYLNTMKSVYIADKRSIAVISDESVTMQRRLIVEHQEPV